MTNERSAIIAEYASRGIEACAGKGGFFVKDRGFVSLRDARKETGISMAKTRTPGTRVSAYGDYAMIACLNGIKG